MKTTIMGFVLIAYCLFYGSYLWMLAHIPLTEEQIKLFNYYPIAFLFLSVCIFDYLGIDTYIQQTFIIISKCLLFFTFIMIILNYHLLISGIYSKLGTIYGGTLLVTTLIEISGLRHGIFKNSYNDGE